MGSSGVAKAGRERERLGSVRGGHLVNQRSDSGLVAAEFEGRLSWWLGNADGLILEA